MKRPLRDENALEISTESVKVLNQIENDQNAHHAWWERRMVTNE